MENKSFNYSYSAKEQAEISKIREKYAPHEESKLEQLRRLDAGVTKKGMIASLILGIIGSLIMGVGMCCCMLWQDTLFIPGVLIGIAGIAMVAVAYPVYDTITKKEREKIAPEIIRLSEELLK